MKSAIAIAQHLTVVLLVSGCYGINERTSEISSLDPRCVDSIAWDAIYKTYSIDKLKDSVFLDAVGEIGSQPFETDVFYFKNAPEELIAISPEHYAIRYVYNPKISSKVLNGFSPELKESDKRRIRKRLYLILMKYQCPEGKANSRNVLNTPVDE